MIRANLKYWFTYILIILFFLFGTIFYRQPFMTMLLLLLIILPFISIAIFKYTNSKLSINITPKNQSLSLNGSLMVTLEINNSSLFPALNLEFYYRYKNLYYPNDEQQIASAYALPKAASTFYLNYKASKYGMISIEFTNYKVTDFLHLVTLNFPIEKTICIPVLPEKAKTIKTLNIPSAYEEGEETTNDNSGYLTRNISDIREYQPGDLLKDIHWKVSAKKDELFIKEYEYNAEHTILILPELTKQCLNDTISNVLSFSTYLLKERINFKILAFDAYSHSIEAIDVNNEDDINSAILKLYYCASYDMKNAAQNSFSYLYGSDKNALIIQGKEVFFI